MIYRRPIRDVVEERHGRTCGVHVFLFYIAALSAVLAMSTACLTATESGFFSFRQEVRAGGVPPDPSAPTDISVDYDITYGWRSMCSNAVVTYTDGRGVEQSSDPYSGCFGLGGVVPLELNIDGDSLDAILAAGTTMMADTGLAVALGHAVAAAVAATHILFFLLLFFNIDPAPVRGYLYMRGLGLMSALSSFYLLFTCVVTFFFAVKGGLDEHIDTSGGLRPSWGYVLTVIDVTLMVVVGMLACQDDEVDAAIATPQYTSSSRDEDTVKRASGKLLHLRSSRSGDTVGDASTSRNVPASASAAPKTTVGGMGGSTGITIGGGGAGARGAQPPTAAVMGGLRVGGIGILHGGGDAGNTVRMSRAASSAAAHAAASAAFGDFTASSPAVSVGSGSGSVLSSWTDGVSALSPTHRESRAAGEEEEDVEEGRSVMSGRETTGSNSPTRTSGSVLDAALVAAPGDHGGGGGGCEHGVGVQDQDEARISGYTEKDAGGTGRVDDDGDRRDDGGTEGKASEGQRGDGASDPEAKAQAGVAPTPPPPPSSATAAAAAAAGTQGRDPERLTAEPAAEAGAAPVSPHAPVPEGEEAEESALAAMLVPVAETVTDFFTARTVLTFANGEPDEDTLSLDAAEAGESRAGAGGSGGLRETFQHRTPPPSGRFPAVEEV